MAGYPKTRFVTNDNLTRKKWARDLFVRIMPDVEYSDLTGKGTDAIVQLRTELGKGEGDTITFGIRLPLAGEGRVGREEVEGHEEELRFRDFNVTIEELNHAVDTGGRMDQQRVPYNLMEEGRNGLQEWWSDKLSEFLINVLCGNSSYTINGHTFGTTPTEPDVGHHLAVGQDDGTAVATAEAALGAADICTLGFLDRVRQRAENPYTNCRKLRWLKKNGKKYWRVILHNYVFDQLRQNTNVGEWGDLLRNANRLQVPNVEIEYNGMLISKSERIYSPASNVYRNLFLGPQSAVWGWGGAGESQSTTMAFVPYEKDAKRYVMIRGGGIFGMAKARFDSRDENVIAFSSYATAISA